MATFRTRTAPLVFVALALLAGACGATTTSPEATRPAAIVNSIVATPKGHLDQPAVVIEQIRRLLP